ncbi:MAG TPA: response regulator transcription factor [Pyrinomonadaceae bacterium]|nr:response regulator transcription factor [Pyrinomonadaceae bacterium]
MNEVETATVAAKAINVGIIEDRREIREGLGMLIDGTEGFRCTCKFSSMEEGLRRLKADDLPDVMLSDIGLPGMDGIEGIKVLKEKFPELLIVMLSIYDDDERIFNALCAGAGGYLLKKTPPVRLLESLKEAVAGGSPMSPEVARRVITLFRDIRPPERADYDLTAHETRLLKMLVEGHNYKTAAVELNVTVHAVSFHMRRIYEKLQVHSKSEAVSVALRDRLIK